MKEEYTLKFMMRMYNIGFYDSPGELRDMINTLQTNITELYAARNELGKSRQFYGVIGSEVINDEIKKYRRFIKRLTKEQPEYYV